MTATRLATVDDLPALVALFEEREGTRLPTGRVAGRLGGFDPAIARTIVATIDGRVAGMSTLLFREFGTARSRRRVGYWTDLYVADGARGDALYLPLARATLGRAEQDGADAIVTANRRRDVWSGHLKLGFRLASAMPTRARPVSALGVAARAAASPALAALAAPIDAAAFGLVDRVLARPRVALPVVRRSIDREVAETLSALLERDRGRSIGTLHDVDSLLRRFEPGLDGIAYEALLAGTKGAAIVRTARRGPLSLTVVLDVFDGDDADTFHGLVGAIETRARAGGTDLVLVLDGVSAQSSRWAEAGYLPTPEWYVLLVGPADRVVDRALGDGTGWRFPFSEHDAF